LHDLPLSQRTDRMEMEADARAAHVMSSSAAEGPRSPFTALVRRAPRAWTDGGASLDRDDSAFLEPRFGHDFSRVRVHADDRAGQAAEALGARAFTIGTDIVFGKGQYRPRSHDGRKLLAHELSHVVQQAGDAAAVDPPLSRVEAPGAIVQRAAFVDECSDVRSEDDCGGTIDVYGGTISLPALAVSHLYLVYTSTRGRSYAFRGGPDQIGAGYGHVMTKCGPYRPGFVDYDTSNPSVRVYSGPDACTKASCFHDQLASIATRDSPYAPTGPNSNSVVAHLLRHCGLPLRLPVVTAPGFNLAFTAQGTQDLGTTDRRQRFSLGVGPLLGGRVPEAGLTAGYSIDTALLANQTFRVPFSVGALYGPGSGTILGSASLGIESPFLNIPFPGLRVPTSLGISAGIAGGGIPGPTTGLDPALGAGGRANIAADVNRLRFSLFYQYQHLRSLGHDHQQSLHLLGLEAGLTF
jgi:hypothetical protein